MTWRDWVNSGYRAGSARVAGGKVVVNSLNYSYTVLQGTTSAKAVSPDDVIAPDHTYGSSRNSGAIS